MEIFRVFVKVDIMTSVLFSLFAPFHIRLKTGRKDPISYNYVGKTEGESYMEPICFPR